MADDVLEFRQALGAHAPDPLESRRLLDGARRRWPTITVDASGFGALVAAHLPQAAQGLGAIHLEDLALVWACLEGQKPAHDVFVTTFDAAVRQVALRGGVDADELSSRVFQKLLVRDGDKAPSLGRYAGLGPLKSFVLVSAMRLLVDLRRGARPQDSSVDDEAWVELATTVAVDEQGPSARCDWAQLKPHLATALEEAIAALPVRQRNVLRLHYVEDVSAEAIARMYGVHRATTTRWLTDAREQVFAHVQQRLRLELAVGTQTLDSVNRDLANGIELSLPGAFRAAAE
ncbi:MAG: sigma-70 family RNA polymerase sigma factor [Myxococcaceae bacterium]|nr:sigma-70 family RNA polymerase sigma factor [Myxococcaceae bacterium]